MQNLTKNDKILAQDSNQVFYPIDDSMVCSGKNSDNNYSNLTEFSIYYDVNPDNISKALLTFDFSAYKGTSTAFAGLSIYLNSSGDGQTPSLKVYGLSEKCKNIDHSSITWNTLPNEKIYITTITFNKDVTRRVSFNVTDFVNSQMNDKKVTFLIEANGLPSFSQNVTFSSSKDNDSKKPMLTLAEDNHPVVDLSDIMRPIWKTDTIFNETVMMISKDGGIPEASLLFKPSEIISVKNSRMSQEYKEGVDWVIEDGKIKLTPGSQIVSVKYEELYPEVEHPSIRTFKSVTGGFILSPEETWFHDHQVVITYKHKDCKWNGPLPSYAGKLLPKTMKHLKNGDSIKIALLGDSISFGANASSKGGVSPYMPIWGELVAKQLHAVYKSNITFVNPSLGGTVAMWGEQVAPSFVTPEKPDLLIIAFGMNGGNPVNDFIKSVKAIMDCAREGNLDVEFIIVTPMQLNSKWQPLTIKKQYVDALKGLEGEGVAIADMWSFHGELLNHKNYFDMTGNNVNHPNDFLARCYAQVVAELMISEN